MVKRLGILFMMAMQVALTVLIAGCQVTNTPTPQAAALADATENTRDHPLAFLPEIVAKIGDEEITKTDMLVEFKPVVAVLKEKGQLDSITADVWKSEVKKRLDDMIATKLLLKLAEADGYNPDPIKGEKEFKKITAQIPPEQLVETLAKQGMTADTIKRRIAIGLAIQEWIEDKVVKNIKVSNEDAMSFYYENQEKFKKPGSDSEIVPFENVRGTLIENLKKQKTSEILQERIESEKNIKKVEIFLE
jgi:hypothetical protein